MNKLARGLIGLGFVWMTLWAILGSLLGAKINMTLGAADPSWLGSLERTLLRTAHAHMNTMAITVILMGLSYRQALATAGSKVLARTAIACLVSVPVFGLGLMGEAFSSTTSQGASAWVIVTAIGGTGYILSIAAWGIVFLASALKK